MRLKEKWERVLEGSRAAGVEIALKGSESKLSFVLLEKKRSKLEITASGTAAQVSEITMPAGTPVCISISGKGLIHKRVAFPERQDETSLLQKVLPNANISDFYVQHTEPVNDHLFVSVVRKSVVDDLLKEFARHKLEVVKCTLGPFSISALLPAMKLSSMVAEELLLPGHTLTLVDGRIDNYSTGSGIEAASLRIGDENIKGELALPFASAMTYFTSNEISISIPQVDEQGAEFRQKKIFQKSGAAILVFFFALLLSNYFVFNHYWEKKQKFESQISVNQGALQKYNQLKAEFDEKQKFLAETGLLESSRSSYYADQVAIDLPAAIQLTELNIQPRIKKAAEENAMLFQSKTIRVSGTCKRSNELNEWINTIKKKSWVSEVQLLNYKQEKNDPAGAFTLEMKVK